MALAGPGRLSSEKRLYFQVSRLDLYVEEHSIVFCIEQYIVAVLDPFRRITIGITKTAMAGTGHRSFVNHSPSTL